MAAMAELVQSEISKGVLTLTLERPEKKNALTVDMYASLVDGLKTAAADDSVRVVVIEGSHGCFTAGNDLHDFMERPPVDESSPVLQFLAIISQFSKPILAAVDGPAVGIGTTMLLHCDLVFAAPDALFQLPFVPLGLVPEAASSLLLPRLIGYHRAAQLLLLGEPFDARTGLEIGLVNGIFLDAELHDGTQAQAARLAALPPEAVRLTKQLLKSPPEPVSDRITREARIFRDRLASPEARAAMQAFFQRRA